MYRLVIPRRQFEHVVTALLRQPGLEGLGLAGRNYTRTGTALLCRDLALVPVTAPIPVSPEDHVRLRLARTMAELHNESWFCAPPIVQGQPGRTISHLTYGFEAVRGQWTGLVVEAGGRRHPLDTVTLVGAAMATLAPTALSLPPASPTPTTHTGRWRRTIGALGSLDIWQRLIGLRPCIVGLGSTGSLIAATLAQMGVQTLTLIDPQLVDIHHLDTMDGVRPQDIGHAKVAAVAAHLRAMCPAVTVTALPYRVTEHPALLSVKAADVLFCCVDNEAARLVTTALATLFLKPLIDVSTSIVFPPPPLPQPAEVGAVAPPAPQQMGGDVLLLLPGEHCLLCARSLGRTAEAGAPRTLNQIAAHLGVEMFVNLITGRLDASRWAQVTCDDTGLRVGYPSLATPGTGSRCVLCAKAGAGEAGLGWLAL